MMKPVKEVSMNLYLIRHAQPDYEHDTITDLGHKQAAALAEYYADLKIDELYHSSMGRAGITASYLAKKWDLTPQSVDWARELSWGKGNGDAGDRLSPWAIKDMVIETQKGYPEGEEWRNLSEFQNDHFVEDYDIHCKALDTFLSEHGYIRKGQLYQAENPNDKNIVIVCHGGVISALVSYLENVPVFQYMCHMGVDLTAVTKISFRGKKGECEPAQLIYVNSVAHLGEK